MGRPWMGGKSAARLRRIAAGTCVNCCNRRLPDKTRCQECVDKDNQSRLRRHAKLKVEVFNAYGGFHCSCCGESHEEFLHIDHVNGDGAKHRKELKDPTGANMYSWLKRNKFPPGFRVLCANCNWSIGRYGYCPHQEGTPTRRQQYFVTPAELAFYRGELDPGDPIEVLNQH